MKNVIKQLDKSVLIPLGLTAAASASDAEMHKKNYDLFIFQTLICIIIQQH